MVTLDFGLVLMGYRGCWDDAALAERHGFATVGLIDSPLLTGELFACLALTARATSTIRVGSLLAVPHTHPATVAAQGIATVGALAPGRTFFGIGTGYTSRLVMGRPPVAASVMRDYALDVRALLDGEEIVDRRAPDSPPIRFRQPEEGVFELGETLPIYVAAEGPKALRAAGESGDGWVTGIQRSFMMSPHAHEVFRDSRAAVLAAAAEAGRTIDPMYSILSTASCVLRPGESATDDRVIARVGPCAMLAFHTAAHVPDLVDTFPPSWRDRWLVYRRRVLDRFEPSRMHQEIHRGHLTHLLEGEAEVLTEDIIRGTTLTGTREEIVAQLGPLVDAGLSNLTLNFPTGQLRDGLAEVAEQLMPALTDDREITQELDDSDEIVGGGG